MKTFSFSKASILLIGGILLWVSFNVKLWKHDNFVSSDGFSYYEYLPAIFIKHDVKLTFLDTDKQSYFNTLWFSVSPTGTRFTKMGAGLAVMQFPFFMTANLFASKLGYEADGFSLPYRFALCMSTIFYLILGLIVLRKSLLIYFSDTITGIVLLCVVLGTNLMNYVVLDPLMSHAYNFVLFCFMIHATILWHSKVSWLHSVYLGAACGMILLSRAPNGLVFIFPLMFRIYSLETLRAKLQMAWEHRVKILLILAITFLIFSPQLYYYKITTGQWFYYSYRHEKFYFNHPHLIDGLFGFRKGWLIYTPIMIVAVAGFFFLRKKLSEFALPLLVYIPVNIYIVLSWWCWWYGGSFGMRSLIETYALLAFPMGLALQKISEMKVVQQRILTSLVSFLVALNCFQTFQYKHQFITYDCMTWPAYKAVFLKWEHYPDGFMELQECPDYDSAIIGLPEKHKK